MKKRVILLGLAAGMVFMSATAVAAGIRPADTDTLKITVQKENPAVDAAAVADRLAELVNEQRTAAGVKPVTINAELSANAEIRAAEIHDKFAHNRLDGSTFATVITVPNSSYAENIAYYFQGSDILSEEELAVWVADNWISSHVHQMNIIDDRWEETGIGVYVIDNAIFVSQLYIQK